MSELHHDYTIDYSFQDIIASLTSRVRYERFFSESVFLGDLASFDGDKATFNTQQLTPGVPVVVTALYLGLVFVVPRLIMARRAALECKTSFMVWNLILSVFSIWGMIEVLPPVINLLRESFSPSSSAAAQQHTIGGGNGDNRDDDSFPTAAAIFSLEGFRHYLCYGNPSVYYFGRTGYWLFMFAMSKIPELLDTYFLVVRKKPIIMLQWYHHVTVMVYCWHSVLVQTSTGPFFAAMNYLVHAIMYTYFFLMCFKVCRPVVKKIAFSITSLQILQMVIGFFISVATVSELYLTERGQRGECVGLSKTNVVSSALMYSSYFLLFAAFFKKAYCSSSGSGEQRKKTTSTKRRKED